MGKKKEMNFVSRDTEFINNRFLVKASVLEKAGSTSIMLVINDLLESNFKIQFFKQKEDAYNFVRLLQAID